VPAKPFSGSGSFTHLLEGVARVPLQITDVKTTRLT